MRLLNLQSVKVKFTTAKFSQINQIGSDYCIKFSSYLFLKIINSSMVKRGSGDSEDKGQPSSKKNLLGTEILPSPLVSPSDRKSYRHIELPNGLRALLISDSLLESNSIWTNEALGVESYRFHPTQHSFAHDFPQSSTKDFSLEEILNGPREDTLTLSKDYEEYVELKAAFCLIVNAGNGDDPLECQGLAHFTEHMLHYGSKKYSDEGLYWNLVKNVGGYINAYTQLQSTAYLISINPDFLGEAMNLFGHCVSEPSFDTDTTKREVESVDNEFWLHKSNDFYKYDEILRQTAKKDHPLSKFSCGTTDTLTGKGNLHQQLIKFHRENYVANKMTLAVQSTESLDVLQDFVEKSFSSIRSDAKTQRDQSDNLREPFLDKEFSKLYQTVGERKLILTWRFGADVWRNKSKPILLLETLMNNSSKGGLIEILMNRGWIVEMYCGSPKYDMFQNDYCTIFITYIILTESGEKNIEKIVQTIFQYLATLRDTPVNKFLSLWNELKYSSEKDFIHSGSGNPKSNVHFCARKLMTYDSEPNFLTEHRNFEGPYDHQPLSSVLESLLPKNTLFVQYVPGELGPKNSIQTTKHTKYPFVAKNIPKEFLTQSSDEAFEFPNQNRFISTKMSIRPNNTSKWIAMDKKLYMVLLAQPSRYLAWDSPKCRCRIALFFSEGCKTILGQQMLQLLVFQLNVKIQAEITLAARAGIQAQVVAYPDLIFLYIVGYPEKMFDLVSKFCQIMNEDDILGNNFATIKEYGEFLTNLEDPLTRLWYLQYSILKLNENSVLETPNKLNSVTKEEFATFFKSLKSSMFIYCGLEGNVSSSETFDIKGLLQGIRYTQTKEMSQLFSEFKPDMSIPSGERTLRIRAVNSKTPNNAISNLYQLMDNSMDNLRMCHFIAHLMNARAFQILRTRQQLGYWVFVQPPSRMPVTFFVTVICPNFKHTVCDVNNKIDMFLRTFYDEFLMKMTDKEFRDTKLKFSYVFNDYVSLEKSQTWYKQHIYDSISTEETDPNRFKMLGKISLQVLGSCSVEGAKASKICGCSACSSVEFKPSGNTQIEFATHKNPESDIAKKYKFIDNIAKFQEENKK